MLCQNPLAALIGVSSWRDYIDDTDNRSLIYYGLLFLLLLQYEVRWLTFSKPSPQRLHLESGRRVGTLLLLLLLLVLLLLLLVRIDLVPAGIERLAMELFGLAAAQLAGMLFEGRGGGRVDGLELLLNGLILLLLLLLLVLF